MLVRLCSKLFKLGFSSMWTENFQMHKLALDRQRNQRSNCQHSVDHRESKGIPENHLLLLHWRLCVDHNKLWEILKEMEIPDHLICLLRNLYVVRNLYVGQEAIIITLYGATDWFKIWKGIRQACLLPLCLFNFYVEYIMQNAGLDKSQAGIKIAGRNVNNLRYADDITLMAESWRTKDPFNEGKEESEKGVLNSGFKKWRSRHLVPLCYLFRCVRPFMTLWTVAHQVSLPMEFSRQEYWSR